MIRSAAALVFALTIGQAPVVAQDAVFTVTVPTASVYQGPSNVTPAVGHVSRGTVLPVMRNLGSWVRVPWPDAPEGVGYLHVTMGRVAETNGSAPPASAPPLTASTAGIAPTPQPQANAAGAGSSVPSRQAHRESVSHTLGVGGLVGSMSSFGTTARAWRAHRLGLQFGWTRDVVTSDVAAGRVTSMQFEPGVVYALFDRITDYVWMRPYVGSVLSVRRERFDPGAPVDTQRATDTGLGVRVFGGCELMFAAVPRFGLSADVGYRHVPTPFSGFKADPLTFSIGGHWYIK